MARRGQDGRIKDKMDDIQDEMDFVECDIEFVEDKIDNFDAELSGGADLAANELRSLVDHRALLWDKMALLYDEEDRLRRETWLLYDEEESMYQSSDFSGGEKQRNLRRND